MIKFKIKSKNKYEYYENLAILLIFIGVVLFSLGIGLSIIIRSVSALFAMLGALLSFVGTVFFILVWFIQDLKHGKNENNS